MKKEELNITNIRKYLGLTQKQVFEQIGTPIQTMHQWEHGKRKCPDYVEKLIINELKRNFKKG